MRALRSHGGVLINGGFICCAREFGDRGLADILQWRRSEIARVSGVKRRPLEWLVNDVDARTQLVFVYKSVFKIEAATEIDRKRLERLPFVLQVESIKIAVLAAVIDDAPRDVTRLIAVGVNRKNQCCRSD